MLDTLGRCCCSLLCPNTRSISGWQLMEYKEIRRDRFKENHLFSISWDLFWNKWNGKTKERQEDWPFGRSTKPKIRMKWCILQWGRWHHARLSSQWNLYELGGALAQNHSFIFFYKTCKKRNLRKYWSVTSVKLCEDKTISSIIWTSTWCLLIFTALFFSYRLGASDFAMFTITLGIYPVYFIL